MPLTTTTTADTAIPEVWSKLTYDYREANLLWVNLYDRKYEEEFKGIALDRVNIQGIDVFSTGGEAGTHANTLGVGGTLTYDAARFQTQRILIVDTHAYQAFDLETEAEMMTNIDLLDRLAKAAAYAVAHRIDDDAAAFADDSHSSQTVGALATPLADSDITRSVQYLDDARAPETERYFVLSPAERRNLLAIDKFINQLYAKAVGSMDADKIRGHVANILGLEWFVSQNVEGSNAAGHDNFIFHKDCVAALIMDNMRTASQYEIDTDSTKYAVHSIYGMLEIRTDHGVFARGL